MPRAPLGSSRTNRKAAAKASAAMTAAFEGPESSDDEVFMSIDDHQKECAKERRESRLGLGAAACRSPLTLRPRRVHAGLKTAASADVSVFDVDVEDTERANRVVGRTPSKSARTPAKSAIKSRKTPGKSAIKSRKTPGKSAIKSRKTPGKTPGKGSRAARSPTSAASRSRAQPRMLQSSESQNVNPLSHAEERKRRIQKMEEERKRRYEEQQRVVQEEHLRLQREAGERHKEQCSGDGVFGRGQTSKNEGEVSGISQLDISAIEDTLTAKDALRAQLEALKKSELNKRARAAGVTEQQFDKADDSDNPREALIEILMRPALEHTVRSVEVEELPMGRATRRSSVRGAVLRSLCTRTILHPHTAPVTRLGNTFQGHETAAPGQQDGHNLPARADIGF